MRQPEARGPPGGPGSADPSMPIILPVPFGVNGDTAVGMRRRTRARVGALLPPSVRAAVVKARSRQSAAAHAPAGTGPGGAPETRVWSFRPDDAPWFDQPDAAARLERRIQDEAIPDADASRLRHWLEHGYCYASGLVPETDIDDMVRDMDAVWESSTAIPGLTILDVTVEVGAPPVSIPHEDLLRLPLRERLELKQRSRWRIHAFFEVSDAAHRVFANPELQRLASLILGMGAAPSYTINFTYGSQQKLHQDTAVFHVAPPNYLVGAWIACEDIHADSGPLVYYPGSHREPLYEGFTDYPQTNLRTAPSMEEYNNHVGKRAEAYEPQYVVAKKGDIFLWNGMLIHGGSPVKNPGLTRQSYVCHYIPPAFDVQTKILGPFNW